VRRFERKPGARAQGLDSFVYTWAARQLVTRGTHAAAAMPGSFVTRHIGRDYSAAERERRLQAYERLERQTRMRGQYFDAVVAIRLGTVT
jgi:hypothetical protein